MNLDDPKLTAYALGEITDAAEITEVEIWLARNPEGRAFVTDTQEMAAFLSEKLHATAPVLLTAEQRDSLLAEKKIIPLPARRKWSIIGLTALAACLAAAPLLPWTEVLRLRDSPAPTVAMQMTQDAFSGRVGVPPALEGILPETRPGQDAQDGRQDARPTRNEGESSESSTLLERNKEISTLDAPSLSASLASPLKDQAQGFARGQLAVRRAEPVRDEALAASKPLEIAAAPMQQPVVQQSLRSSRGKDKSEFIAGSLAPSSQTQTLSESFAHGTGSGFGGGGGMKSDDRNLQQANTEAYDSIAENGFLAAKENPLSTFSIDVDTASYANVRRFLNDGQLPPKGAVRIEEMLNYFTYDYAKPEGDAPFSTNLEVASCPWQPEHRLVRIGLKGREIPAAERKAANLVFLIDVSGSMDEPNKLPLLKQSLQLLVDQLGENDRVALTVYAGNSGLVLPSTSNKDAIRSALENLKAGGSTNGASGIQLAYEQAVANFQKDGVNRVILATDGDFNVGVTNQSDLVDLITNKAKSGVFLSVLGFGTGNVKDSTMEKLADKGNGNYAYIDSLREGKKVLVEQMGGTLITIAKDVKIQVEFNPAAVGSYRLVGYENRALKKEDFNDDKKDAGEIGSGHTVTALYEIVPTSSAAGKSAVDPLKYAAVPTTEAGAVSNELLTVKLRYKEPAGEVSKKLEFPLQDDGRKLETASRDFQFASAVAEFGQLLRQSEFQASSNWDALIARAADAKGQDRGGYRAEFIELAKKARELSGRNGRP